MFRLCSLVVLSAIPCHSFLCYMRSRYTVGRHHWAGGPLAPMLTKLYYSYSQDYNSLTNTVENIVAAVGDDLRCAVSYTFGGSFTVYLYKLKGLSIVFFEKSIWQTIVTTRVHWVSLCLKSCRQSHTENLLCVPSLLLPQLPQLLLICREVPADDRWVAVSRNHVRTNLSDDKLPFWGILYVHHSWPGSLFVNFYLFFFFNLFFLSFFFFVTIFFCHANLFLS